MLIDIPASRAEWLALRKKSVGGSEIASLFQAQASYAPSKFALWQEKAGKIEPEDLDEERMRWGLLLEPIIGAEAARINGWGIEKGKYAICDHTPGLAATLDFSITSHKETEHSGPGILQCKCVDWIRFKAEAWDLRPPLFIELQAQHEMIAAGCSWGAIAVLVSGNDLKVWKRHLRPRIADSIRARVRAFWASIEANEPPSVEGDGTDSTSDALKALYAVPLDQEAEVMPEDVERLHAACMAFEMERNARLAAVERETIPKNLLRAFLKDAARAYIPPPDATSPAYVVKRDKRNSISVHQTEFSA